MGRAEPDERRHVVRPNGDRLLKRGNGLIRLIAQPVHVGEVIRPRQLAGSERPGIEEIGLGVGKELGAEQQLADLSVGGGQLVVAHVGHPFTGCLAQQHQRRIAAADPLLQSRLDARELRCRDGAQRIAQRERGCVSRRR